MLSFRLATAPPLAPMLAFHLSVSTQTKSISSRVCVGALTTALGVTSQSSALGRTTGLPEFTKETAGESARLVPSPLLVRRSSSVRCTKQDDTSGNEIKRGMRRRRRTGIGLPLLLPDLISHEKLDRERGLSSGGKYGYLLKISLASSSKATFPLICVAALARDIDSQTGQTHFNLTC